jgi:hypothetical protein
VEYRSSSGVATVEYRSSTGIAVPQPEAAAPLAPPAQPEPINWEWDEISGYYMDAKSQFFWDKCVVSTPLTLTLARVLLVELNSG